MAPKPEEDQEKENQYSSTSDKDQKLLSGLVAGILIGLLIAFFFLDYFPALGTVLLNLLVAIFILAILSFLGFAWFKDKILSKLFGQDFQVENIHGELKNLYNLVAQQFTGKLLKEYPSETREKAKIAVPRFLRLAVWSLTRNYVLRLMVAVFVAIGGLLGAILLYNQNQLLSKQNQMLDLQNNLLDTQNDRLDVQNNLMEAERRSSLVFLMSNILDKVDEEIITQRDSVKRRHRLVSDSIQYGLGKPLISRIVALSRSFRPYRRMEGDTLSRELVSPERGQLFVAVMGNRLDSITQNNIVKTGDFSNAQIKQINLEEAHLSGAKLNGADLSKANLRNADLSGAYLEKANLQEALMAETSFFEAILNRAKLNGAFLNFANLNQADLSQADLSEAKLIQASLVEANLNEAVLHDANLPEADLSRANLHGADLSGADLRGAILKQAFPRGANFKDANLENTQLNGADLSGADFTDVKNLTFEQLLSAYSIYSSRGLGRKLEKQLKAERPCLFTKEGCYD